MYAHLVTDTTTSWLGVTRYRLTARLFLDHDEADIVRRHKLDRIALFTDPARDEWIAAADAAHDAAKAHGIIATKPRTAAAITVAETRALIATLRAAFAFQLNVADLIADVAIDQPDLRSITDIQLVLTDCIDRIDAAVRAARSYADGDENMFTPGDDPPETTVPPADWTRGWGR